MGRRLPEGISARHARSCPSRSGGRCACTPRYQAQAWSPRDRKRISRTFGTCGEAIRWRRDDEAYDRYVASGAPCFFSASS
jgi:integrase